MGYGVCGVYLHPAEAIKGPRAQDHRFGTQQIISTLLALDQRSVGKRQGLRVHRLRLAVLRGGVSVATSTVQYAAMDDP